MPITVQASVNGGVQQTGRVTVAAADVVQFSLASTAGVSTLLWEIYSHPTADAGASYEFALPSGWTLAADGHTYFSTDAAPDPITIPGSPYWGKILIRATPDGDGTRSDESLVLRLDSTNGVVDAAPFEEGQDDAYRAWMAALQVDLRKLDEAITAGSGASAGPTSPATDANHVVVFDLADVSGNPSNAGSGTAFTATATGGGTVLYGVPTPVGDGVMLVGVKSFQGGSAYSATTTNITAECIVEFLESPVGGAGDVTLFGKIHASGSTFAIYVDNSGIINADIRSGGANTTCSGIAIVVGKRHHMVMTYDGSNVRLYVDGALVGTTAATGTLNWDTGQPYVIGNAGTASGYVLRNCRVSDVVRSGATIKAATKQINGWAA